MLVVGPRKKGGIERPAAGVLARAGTEYDERVAVEVENSDRFIILEVGHAPGRFWPWQSSKNTRAALTRAVSETPSLFKTPPFPTGSLPADK